MYVFRHALTENVAYGSLLTTRRQALPSLDKSVGESWSELCYTGEWEIGIKMLQQALPISPDAFESAFALGYLGHAYLEQGNVLEALPILEQAVLDARQYRSRQVQYRFQRHLSQAYLLSGNIEKSRVLALQVLDFVNNIKASGNIRAPFSLQSSTLSKQRKSPV